MAETKIWNGSAWVSVRPKVYNGTSWETEGRFRDADSWEYMYPEIDVGPVVDPTADGRSNSVLAPPETECYSGVRFATSGQEREYLASGGTTYVGDWLISGNPSEVWVAYTRTGGNNTSWDSGQTNGTRYQLNVDRSFWMRDGTAAGGGRDITGYFTMYDASTGGNVLGTSQTANYSAWLEADGCPTCCFTPDTLILMADGTHMPIGDFKGGELIRVANGIESVTRIIVRENRFMFKLTFNDGKTLILSDDHPIFVEHKGYACVRPIYGDYKDMGVPKKLEIGDRAITEDGRTVRLESIAEYEYPLRVYTFGNSGFFAGGILVY